MKKKRTSATRPATRPALRRLPPVEFRQPIPTPAAAPSPVVPVPASPPLRRITAAELRESARPVDVEVRPGCTVAIRQTSLLSLLFERQPPPDVVNALARLDAGMRLGEVAEASDADRAALIAALRWYACAVVVDPVVVPAADGDPTHGPSSHRERLRQMTRTVVTSRSHVLSRRSFHA